MRRSERRITVAGAVVAVTLIACAARPAVPTPTPTSAGGAGGPRYTAAPAPAAYLILDPAGDQASLYSVDGQLLEVLSGLDWWLPRQWSGATVTPLQPQVGLSQIGYFRSSADGVVLNLRRGGEDSPLASLRAPVGLCGSIPAGYLAVSDEIMDEQTGGLFSAIYVIEAGTGRGAEEPALRLTTRRGSPQPLPLAIGLLAGSPAAVYYTLAAPSDASTTTLEGRGLFGLDLVTRDVTMLVDSSNRILGISPDLTFVAFYSAERTPPEIRLMRLDGASTVLFQPVSGTREAWGAVFSPDSSRLAWGTVVAEPDAEVSFRLSLASTFGGPITPVDLTATLASDQDPLRLAYPVAWLTSSVLLIQVERESSSAVYRYATDTGEMGAPENGLFITLLYP